jgi:RluA family pseudouridine synthase
LLKIPIHGEFLDWSVIEYLGVLWPDRAREALRDLFAFGRVRSGGKPVSTRRLMGDIADLEIVGGLEGVPAIHAEAPAEALPGEPAPGPIAILHEDERFTVLAKPSGVAVVPDRRKQVESCLGFLIRRELAARADKEPAEFLRYRVVHRIDRLTSGLVIVAKSPEAERRLGWDFENRRVVKEYAAILEGVVEPARFSVNCPVVPGRKGKMRAETLEYGKTGGSALTDFEVAERFADHTLVRVFPKTGRTHQIRVHAWAAGHPLAIDPLYGPKNPLPLPGIDRLTLHACRYALPETWEEPREFTCPLPDDFCEALRGLRGEGVGQGHGKRAAR